MDSDCVTVVESISSCISILKGDLHQPGTPAIVFKLAASWDKLKQYLCKTIKTNQLQEDTEESALVSEGEESVTSKEDGTLALIQATAAECDLVTTETEQTAHSAAESNGQGLTAQESHDKTQSSGLLPKFRLTGNFYSLLLFLSLSPSTFW